MPAGGRGRCGVWWGIPAAAPVGMVGSATGWVNLASAHLYATHVARCASWLPAVAHLDPAGEDGRHSAQYSGGARAVHELDWNPRQSKRASFSGDLMGVTHAMGVQVRGLGSRSSHSATRAYSLVPNAPS